MRHTSSFRVPRSAFRVFFLALLACLLLDSQSAQSQIINPNSSAPAGRRSDGPYTIGYNFTVGGSNITINALGVEDITNSGGVGYGDGTVASTSAGIWNTGGTLLGSVTVGSGISAPIIDGFRYTQLGSPIVLSASTTYTLGAQKGPGVDYFSDGHPSANYVVGPGITGSLVPTYNGGALLAKPTTAGGGTNGRWSGANALNVGDATWTLLSSGNASGSWHTNSNWNTGNFAAFTGYTADFSTLNITADSTITLNGTASIAGVESMTIGHLKFGDTTASNNWILNAGTGSGLALRVTSGTPTITVDNQTATINLLLTGTQGMAKNGAGTLTLGSSNTYSGGTTVSAGTLTLSAGTALGSGLVTVGANGTLTATTNNTLGTNSANSMDVSGTVSVAGNVLQFNTLSMTGGLLTGTNTGTTQQWINRGTVTIIGSAGGSTVTGGALELRNGATDNTANFGRTFDVADGAADADLTISSAIINSTAGGSVGIIKSGAGKLVLSGASTFTGQPSINASVQINAGILEVSNLQNSGTASNLGSSGSIALLGGTLRYTGSSHSTNRMLELGTAGSTIDASGTGAVTFSGSNGGAAQTGNRTLTLTGTSTSANTISFGLSEAAFGGALSLVKSDVGTWVLSGNSTYTGTTSVSDGILNIRNNSALGGTGTGTSITSGATLQLQNNITVGAEALTINGAGETGQNGALINVADTNNYGGLLTLGSDSVISSDAGLLNLTNVGTITGSGFDLTLTGAGNGSVSSIIGTGGGDLTKLGGGIWTLSGNNTYSGNTTVSVGTLALSHASNNNIGSSPVIRVGATLDVTSLSASTLALTANQKLQGSGSVLGNVTAATSGSIISPGNSIESLLITGDITFGAGSTFDYEINSGAALAVGADLLYGDGGTGGALNISGSPTLSLTNLGAGIVAAGTKFTLIAYDTGEWNGGIFAGRPDDSLIYGFAGINWWINYNDTSAGSNFPGDAGSPNTAWLTITATTVPEPSTYALGLLGLVALACRAWAGRRRMRATALPAVP